MPDRCRRTIGTPTKLAILGEFLTLMLAFIVMVTETPFPETLLFLIEVVAFSILIYAFYND